MTSPEYLDLAAEITFLQHDLVQDVRRGVKLEYFDFTERVRILTVQFLECVILAGCASEAHALHQRYWKLATEKMNGEHRTG
jgi:hypothetical protein